MPRTATHDDPEIDALAPTTEAEGLISPFTDLDYLRALHARGVTRDRETGDLVHTRLYPRGIGRNAEGRWVMRYDPQVRRVALTIEEAQAKGWDFYSLKFGCWVWGGVKRATDSPENLGSGSVNLIEELLPPDQIPPQED